MSLTKPLGFDYANVESIANQSDFLERVDQDPGGGSGGNQSEGHNEKTIRKIRANIGNKRAVGVPGQRRIPGELAADCTANQSVG